MSKGPIQLRDLGGSFTLPEGSGPIRFMCPLSDWMEIYTTNATFRVETPNVVDPRRTNPNARWVLVRTDDVGCSEPAVARSFLMAHEILHQGALDSTIDSQAVLKRMHNLKTTLVQCLKGLKRYKAAVESEIVAVEATDFRLAHGGRALEKFPQVSDFDAQVTGFLIAARNVIREVCALVAMFVKLSKKHSNLEHLARNLAARVPQDSPLAQVLNSHLLGSKRICDLRNGKEHPEEGKELYTHNFEQLPTNELRQPVWHIGGEAPVDIATEMGEIVEFLIRLVEESFVACVDLRLSKTFPFAFLFVENPPPDAPIRFQLTLDTSRMKFSGPSKHPSHGS